MTSETHKEYWIHRYANVILLEMSQYPLLRYRNDCENKIIGCVVLFTGWFHRFTDTSAPGHFGPKTLRQLYLVPKCPEHFGTGAEVSEDASGRSGRPTAGESDSDVSIRTHVFRTVSSCFATLRQLRSIRRSTSQAVLLSLVVSLVLSSLNYSNATLAGRIFPFHTRSDYIYIYSAAY